MVWGCRDSDDELVLVPRGDKNQLIFEGLPPAFQNKKTMKLAPTNRPGKAIVVSYATSDENGTKVSIKLGDE